MEFPLSTGALPGQDDAVHDDDDLQFESGRPGEVEGDQQEEIPEAAEGQEAEEEEEERKEQCQPPPKHSHFRKFRIERNFKPGVMVGPGWLAPVTLYHYEPCGQTESSKYPCFERRWVLVVCRGFAFHILVDK